MTVVRCGDINTIKASRRPKRSNECNQTKYHKQDKNLATKRFFIALIEKMTPQSNASEQRYETGCQHNTGFGVYQSLHQADNEGQNIGSQEESDKRRAGDSYACGS